MTRRVVPRPDVRRYRVAMLTVLVALSIALWPEVLVPLARAYIRLCAFVPERLPASLHHHPPYVVATILLAVATLAALSGFLLLRQIVRQRRLTAVLTPRQSSPEGHCVGLANAAGVDGRLVIVDDRALYAFCAGLLSPRIYLSRGLIGTLEPSELAAVLHHEATHLRQYDPLRLFLSDLLELLTAPFPVLRALIARFRIRIELAADQAALAVVPPDVLASALLKVARARSAPEYAVVVAGLTPSEARIAALAGRPVTVPLSRQDLLVTFLVAVSLLAVLVDLAGLPILNVPVCHTCPPF